jgi:3-hydroxyisobutyrate dehydrogenase-like beta-hydroxyacid dehydrogenase
MYEDKSL